MIASGPNAAQFTADFPIGSVDFINVSLIHDAQTQCPSDVPNCLIVGGGTVSAPEPASLSILGAALGLYLLVGRAVRRPEEPARKAVQAAWG